MAKKPIGGLTAAMLGNDDPTPVPSTPAAVDVPAPRIKNVAITGKLDPALYLRLKTHGAATRQSNQDIIIAALIEYLDRHGPI